MPTRPIAVLAASLSVAGGLTAAWPAWAQQEAAVPMFQTQVAKSVLDATARAFLDPAAERRETTAPAGAPLQTAFRPSPEITRKIQGLFADFVAKRASDADIAKVGAAVTHGDPAKDWARIAAVQGLKPHDTADALAAYWVLSWQVANGAEATRAQSLGVREQVLGVLARNPAYGRLDDAGRQDFAETLMLNFLLQHGAFVDATQRKDAAALRPLGDAAATRFKAETGVDLRALALTDKGLVPKR
ncbi:DUF6683 family protein [Mitsuaria sp. GD03876]|uniref:DUF6683 family protein n=1 Tax=Mitsuaria sp. GD03876 TaxID=2975399 RepID=UPI00244C23D7|nr:DUF6683 family protein [Mitsuaria sp. GD03876]MDH0863540.1 hypothetical protein [Mitsuaria sp. GD03876]